MILFSVFVIFFAQVIGEKLPPTFSIFLQYAQCNNRNATFQWCPDPCPATCANPDGTPYCNRQCQHFGCECYPGYVVDDKGRCIQPQDCPDYLRCGNDRNATYKECPSACPRTCSFPGGQGPCNRMCKQEGCECLEDFLLSENGKCVQLQDCPGAKSCSANETFVYCNAGCPNNYCPVDDNRGIIACSPPFPCGSGCSCKGNYLRVGRGDDRCILAADCPPVDCTRPNEVWNSCPPPCQNDRCSEIGKPIQCDKRFVSCQPQCVCMPGFYRNDSDICVPEKQCSPVCGYNEMPVNCKTICPPQSCNISYTDYACGKLTCEPGCDCIANYLRNDSGICIPNEQCPPPPVPLICPVNEEPSACKIACPPQTCDSIYTSYLCVADIPCEVGCNCISGYLRNSEGVCIPSEQCPITPPYVCGYNEQYTDCKVTCPPQTCDSLFTKYDCKENTVCEAGCNCLDGYLRNASGICVPTNECFLVTEFHLELCKFTEPKCDVSRECRSTCANPNPQNCIFIDAPKDNQNGCQCKPGYILSNVDGECIRIEECPADQGCNGDPNSIATACPWPCPSTCDSPNANVCGQTCAPVGCQCKPNYILSKEDGRCILPDECREGNPCGVNGTFADCAFRCPNQNCPEDDSGIRVACRPGRPCPSGCLCKQYYRRKSENDDTCVLGSDCPQVKCTRPNEVWNPCSSECPTDECAYLYERTECFSDPNNCQPQCDCINDFYRNSTGICVPVKECNLQCPVPINCRPTCAVPNPPNCPFITPSEVNLDGCNCQQGYIMSDIGGICIKIEDCPTDIGCNGDRYARVKACPLPCPSTCDAPNAIPCKRMCDPIGCECQPGYIMSEINGNCILPNNCKGGNPCGPNESYVPCRAIGSCPSSFCPVNDNRGVAVCEISPFAPCYPGCVCNLNHKYFSRENRTCIQSDKCPQVNCTRPHEIWNSCPIECRSEYCEEVDNPPAACNMLLLNCNPKCICEKSYFRNPETDLCVSSNECRRINMRIQF